MKRAVIVALVLLAALVPIVIASQMGGAPKDWRDGGWRDAEPVVTA